MAHRRLTTLVAAVLAVLCGMGLGGCTLPTGPSTPPSGTPSPKPLPAHVADAKSRVASLAGVTHVEVSYSPDRFGYPSALTADVTAGAGADPIDILDRAYFELFKTAQTVDVFVVRQGQLWDGTHIGLAHVPAAADMARRYATATGTSFPTPPPPRPTPVPDPLVDIAWITKQVRSIAGVSEAMLALTKDGGQRPKSIGAEITVPAGVDPVDVLDRAFFVIHRDAPQLLVTATATRAGSIWDGTHLGLPPTAAPADLDTRYGRPAYPAAYPTPPLPRPATTS